LVYGTGGVGEAEIIEATPDYCGLPVPTVEPLPDCACNASDTMGQIIVMNPQEMNTTIGFLFDEQPFELAPGMMQAFDVPQGTIRFDQGGSLGEASYTLRSGSFKFKTDGNSATLVRTKFRATLDNSVSRYDFNVLINDQSVVVPAGSVQQVESDFPIVAAFDDGTGQTVSRSLADGQTVTVGINSDNQTWDLFDGDAAASGAQSSIEPRTIGATEPPRE
jgi:hypothetical protein